MTSIVFQSEGAQPDKATGRRHVQQQLKEQDRPRGKMTRVNTEVHPAVKPTEHRDDRMASTAAKFQAHPSVAERMKAGDEARVAAAVLSSHSGSLLLAAAAGGGGGAGGGAGGDAAAIAAAAAARRGKGKPVAPDRFHNVSPKSSRETRLAAEHDKFVSHAGIAQLMGEKDRALPAKPTGKTRGVKDVENVPESVTSGVDGRNQRLAAERDKFSASALGVMTRIGEQDHPLLSRKRVIAPKSALAAASSKAEASRVAAAASTTSATGGDSAPSGDSQQTNNSAPAASASPVRTSTVTTAELLNPEPAARTIVRRTTHAGAVRGTYEEAIAARVAKRQEAQEALANACDFLSTFSESDSKPFHPSLRHVELAIDTYGTVPCAQVLGFPGMGSHSRTRIRGCKTFKADEKKKQQHADPYSSTPYATHTAVAAASASSASPPKAAAAAAASGAALSPASARMRTLDSSRLAQCITFPHKDDFSPRLKKRSIVTQPPRAAFCCAEAPEWWMTNARKTTTNPWARAEAQAERASGRRHCAQPQPDHITVRAVQQQAAPPQQQQQQPAPQQSAPSQQQQASASSS